MRSRAAVAVLMFALGAVACGETAPSTPPPAVAMLTFAETTELFPDTVIDRVVDSSVRSIVLTNVGEDVVTPTLTLTSEADFAIEGTTCASLSPGTSCEVVVRFVPRTLGARSADLVATADAAQFSTTLAGVSVPEPGLSVAPTTSLVFGDVDVGASRVRRLSVRNDSAVTARPYAIAIIGTHAADYTFTETCTAEAQVAGEECEVDVVFAPSAYGVREAQLVVTSGNLGTRMVALDGLAGVPASLAVSPDVGAFGAIFAPAQSAPQTFTVTNTGTRVSPSVQVALDGTGYFQLTSDCAGPLAGGQSCTFTIVYRTYIAGTHTDRVTITAGMLAPIVVPLTGTAEPSQLTVTPSFAQHDPVPVGQSLPPSTFTVKNIGATNTGALAVMPLAMSLPLDVVYTDSCAGADLAPDATCTIVATATPTVRGPKSVTFRITAPRGDMAQADLYFRGVIETVLTSSPAMAALGDVQRTEKHRVRLVIENEGDGASGPLSVALSGDNASDVTIVDGCVGRSLFFEQCVLTIEVAPSQLGSFNATVEVIASTASLVIPLTANVLPAPPLTVSPDAVLLNPTIVGETTPVTFVVEGTNASPTGALSVALTGVNASDFAVTQDACTGLALGTGEACTLTVSVSPSASGARDATLVVSEASGGYRRIPMTAIAFRAARLTVSPSTLQFWGATVGSTKGPYLITVSNTGERATGPLTVELSGTDATEFGVASDTCSGVALPPYSSCSVYTHFAPTELQTSTAVLSITGSPGGTGQTTLTGTGQAPAMLSSPTTSHTFPTTETLE